MEESLARRVAARMDALAEELAGRWLARVQELIEEEVGSVFPSPELLDHMPGLLRALAADLRSSQTIEGMSAAVQATRQLGSLRHQQGASVHQILREFDLLAVVLEEFVLEEMPSLAHGLEADTRAVVAVVGRLLRCTRILTRITLDAFTERYARTIAEQSARLETYNRVVTHELRGYVGTLANVMSLLDERAPTRADAEAIRESVEGMMEVLGAIGSLGQASGRAEALRVQEVDLGALVEDVVHRLREPAAARGIDVRVEGPFPKLVVEPSRVDLVLVNLLTNAVKYSDSSRSDRGIWITGLHADAEAGFEVRDNGVGIPAEAKERVFERFHRAHPQLGETGDGLGLAIVRESVEALGGRVELLDAPGGGTRVRVWLPRAAGT
jgi:signal transduction histidine kinase